MKTVAKFHNTVEEREHVWIPLDDGCRLAARIWLPADVELEPVPAILEYLPYRKRDGTAARDALTHPYFAGHGYAAVRVDMRGNGDADGLMWDEYAPQEQSDALEVINWLVEQPWCDGNVGMIGISWGGFNGLQVAALRPPALKAIITLCSTDDRFADDIHYKGGCLLNENLGWGSVMQSYSSRPPDPALVGESWRETWLQRLENQPLLAAVWLQHQARDDYWRHGSVCEDWKAIQAATLAVGGWGDAYSNAVPRLLNNLTAPCKAIVGPWVHSYPHLAAPEPRIGFLQEALRWWDRWLKGRPTGVEDDPAIRAYVMESVPPQTSYTGRAGRWIEDQAWPPVSTETQNFQLDGLGRLTDSPSDTTPKENYVSICSSQTCGLDGGEYCIMRLGPEHPGDQRHDDAGSLVFQTAPLSAGTDVIGSPVVHLKISADCEMALVVVRLCDVRPDGGVTRMTYGVFNLTHRNGPGIPQPIVPGEIMSVSIAMDDVAYHVPAGHRLRLSVSSSYWPMVWPSPQAVTLTVDAGRSHFNLPVCRDATALRQQFEEPEAAPALRLSEIRAASHDRTVQINQADRTTVLSIIDDFGARENLDTGLVTGEVMREKFTIHPDNPLSAQMDTHWTQTLSRSNWSVRTEARAHMHADAKYFYLTGEVEAFEGDQRIHQKKWDERIPRRYV